MFRSGRRMGCVEFSNLFFCRVSYPGSLSCEARVQVDIARTAGGGRHWPHVVVRSWSFVASSPHVSVGQKKTLYLKITFVLLSAVLCVVLCAALCCSVLVCVVLCFKSCCVLLCAVCFTVLLCCPMLVCASLCSVVLCCAVLCFAASLCAALCCSVLRCALGCYLAVLLCC